MNSRLTQAEVLVPPSGIASMSLSCGAGGHADDVGQLPPSFGRRAGGRAALLAADASQLSGGGLLRSLCDVSTVMFCSRLQTTELMKSPLLEGTRQIETEVERESNSLDFSALFLCFRRTLNANSSANVWFLVKM